VLPLQKWVRKLYAWQDAGMQQRIKDQTNNAKASLLPQKLSLYITNPQEKFDVKGNAPLL
jgi:hypothetical protein